MAFIEYISTVNIKSILPFNIDKIPSNDGCDYIIAGGFIHDIVNGIYPNDIDIYVFNNEALIKLIKYFELFKESNVYFVIYPCLVEVRGLRYPIQIINSIGQTPNIVERFDLEYVKCYYTGNSNTIMATTKCIEMWKTKQIDTLTNGIRLTDKRVLKSIKKGYMFSNYIIRERLGLPISVCETVRNKGDLMAELKHNIKDCKYVLRSQSINKYKIITVYNSNDVIKCWNSCISKNIIKGHYQNYNSRGISSGMEKYAGIYKNTNKSKSFTVKGISSGMAKYAGIINTTSKENNIKTYNLSTTEPPPYVDDTNQLIMEQPVLKTNNYINFDMLSITFCCACYLPLCSCCGNSGNGLCIC